LLDELKEVMEGKRLAEMEQIYGVAQIQATFPFEKSTVLGIKVMDGRIARGDKIRFMRGEEQIVGESSIVSLRTGKEVTSKVEAGNEAGILISPLLDFQVGDVILSHS
jgi:translation initiation factor IF-2